MNKEIEAIDLAIQKLQETKEKTLKRLKSEAKSKQKKKQEKISPKDKTLIQELIKLAKWWRTEGPKVEKTIKITVKANVLWTEDKTPYIDGYDFYYNDEAFDFDELIRNGLFEKELEVYQKQINSICDHADKLEAKYPGTELNIFT